jgi:hypothetical protein
MKKYALLFIAVAVLVLGTAVALNVSAKSMSADCVEDGSCCEDVNNCTCG